MFPYYVELEIEFIEPIEELDRKDLKKFRERLKSILGESTVPKEIIVERNGGGVLVSKKHILTAAHLFYPEYWTIFFFREPDLVTIAPITIIYFSTFLKMSQIMI